MKASSLYLNPSQYRAGFIRSGDRYHACGSLRTLLAYAKRSPVVSVEIKDAIVSGGYYTALTTFSDDAYAIGYWSNWRFCLIWLASRKSWRAFATLTLPAHFDLDQVGEPVAALRARSVLVQQSPLLTQETRLVSSPYQTINRERNNPWK